MANKSKEVCVASLKVRLANLYLSHVIAFVRRTKIVDCNDAEVEPDESMMRHLEFNAGIPEYECVAFRQSLESQFKCKRMDLLYLKFEGILDLLLRVDSQRVEIWFEKYPHIIPIVKVFPGYPSF